MMGICGEGGNALRLENVAGFRVQRLVPRGTWMQARNAAAVFGIPAMETSLCYALFSFFYYHSKK